MVIKPLWIGGKAGAFLISPCLAPGTPGSMLHDKKGQEQSLICLIWETQSNSNTTLKEASEQLGISPVGML